MFFERLREFDKNMDEDFKKHMEDKLIIEELDAAILRMSKGKSPGLDGLTVEFYTVFQRDIRVTLYNAFVECISAGHLSPTMKQGLHFNTEVQ